LIPKSPIQCTSPCVGYMIDQRRRRRDLLNKNLGATYTLSSCI
jgi:hypothetical protein